MALFEASEKNFADVVRRLIYTNPFEPQRIALERQALGESFDASDPVWSLRVDRREERGNMVRLVQRVEALTDVARRRWVGGALIGDAERDAYEHLVFHLLYHRYRFDLHDVIEQAASSRRKSTRVACWRPFEAEWNHYLRPEGRDFQSQYQPDHLFACFFQIRRAFHHVFASIVGASMPSARLRASVWQSIFTHDMNRYVRSLYRRMGDLSTLVTGPSGTGKELVASAIARSRYVPFDPEAERFSPEFSDTFYPLNLSAMSPTLIESELFGHKKGAFTGAVADRTGWLEACPALGTVFLDEIGELDPAIQVKLLRVLQSRTFQRLGETGERLFEGKIIAATNRDLTREMREGRFREDLYYRLCSDLVTTPSLHAQIVDTPEDLHHLVRFLARRVAEEEAEPLAQEVIDWIETQLGRDYLWPGNIRELEQCVRNVLIRRTYRPAGTPRGAGDPRRELGEAVAAGELDAQTLWGRYCALVFAQTGSYVEAAKHLGVDRRTVKAKIDTAWLHRLSREHAS